MTGKTAIKVSLTVAAVLFIGLGILNKDYMDVLRKAVMICLECIGIG